MSGMNGRDVILGALAGAVATAGLMLAFGGRTDPKPSTRPQPSNHEKPSDREAENARLRAEVAALQKRLEERPEPPPAAPSPKDVADEDPVDLKKEFAALVARGMMGMQGEKAAAFIRSIKREGERGRTFLLDALRNGESSAERFMAAAMLEGIGDPEAVPELARLLPLEKDSIVRRMISHALAVIGTDGAADPLRVAMGSDADWGVRVNSAYGVAKQGGADGLRYLEEAYGSPDTPPEYRIPVLGGLADVAAPETAPLFRKILGDTTDAAYLLIAISALEKMKDPGAVGPLQSVAAAEVPESVKEAARKAIATIGTP